MLRSVRCCEVALKRRPLLPLPRSRRGRYEGRLKKQDRSVDGPVPANRTCRPPSAAPCSPCLAPGGADMRADSRNRIGAWTASSTRIGLAARDAWTRLSTLLFFNRQLLSLLLVLGVQPGLVSWAGEQVDYGRVKGDALKEVLRPLPPKEPDEALRLLEVIEGFSVEYVAHEPLVLDPVAAAIDENGLLYVAEDADYPYRPKEGEKPLGRIRLLKDSDNDGYYEESHLFADGLLWPAGVAPWKGGVFVAAPPDIWYLKDTNGDGKADIREKVYTGFGTGNQQAMLNNLQWGLDHKIYASVAGNGGFVRRADRPAEIGRGH